MRYRIAVIENKLFEPLYINCLERDLLIKTTEEKVSELLLNTRVEIAMMTPLSFAKISKKGDWRILPTTVLATKGYSELLTLSFKQNMKTLDHIYFEDASEYLISIAKILLAEKYDIQTNITNKAYSIEDFDAFISYFAKDAGKFTIDLSEEWFDTFEFPLPFVFWVVPAEIEDTKILLITEEIKDNLLAKSEQIEEYADEQSHISRSGEIIWRWNDEIEEAIDKTMDLLFYHHIIDDIPDTKVFGRDYSDDN